MLCPVCGASGDSSQLICPACGVELCPQCDRVVRVSDGRCRACGQALDPHQYLRARTRVPNVAAHTVPQEAPPPREAAAPDIPQSVTSSQTITSTPGSLRSSQHESGSSPAIVVAPLTHVVRRPRWALGAVAAVILCGALGFAVLRSDRTAATPVVAPGSAAPSVDEAIDLANQKKYDAAINAFLAMKKRGGDTAVIEANLCAVYLQDGRRVDAVGACNAAIALDGRSWLAHYNMACARALDGQTAQAVASLGDAFRFVEQDRSAPLTRRQLAEQARHDQMLASLRHVGAFIELVRSD